MIVTALPFAMLSAARVHDVLRLRQDVFVVEQACAYPDIDGRDTEDGTRHVLLIDGEDESGPLVGCARVLDDGEEWRIGRVVLTTAARGHGLADVLLETALEVCPDHPVVLDAQTPLVELYARFGFEADGEEFLEDDIAHVPMRRPAA